MKIKFLLILGLLVLLCLPAGLALADNGVHGNYTATTDACAGCHRAHTASGFRLLIADTITDLCFSCHGSSGNGADTNVVDGLYSERDNNFVEGPLSEGGTAGSSSLKGGGFVFATMNTDWSVGVTVPAGITSDHLVNGQAITTGTVWGNLNPSGPFPVLAPGYYSSSITYTGPSNFSFSCVSCHDPHGGANAGGATYRILKTQPISTASGPVVVADEADKFYTLSDSCKKTGERYFGEGYTYVNCVAFFSTWTIMDTPETSLSQWCSQCHTRYMMATNGTTAEATSGNTNTGDPIFTYRHRTTSGPSVATCAASICHGDPASRPMTLNTWGGSMWNHNVECMTCHVAHGSSATMGSYSGNVEWPGGGTSPSGNARSSLLRVDNRGTCQLCHGK